MANKILYISHFEEPSGWGEAARNYILAMDGAGLDIVIRSIRPNKQLMAAPLNPRLVELSKKSLEGCNICIQHLLPHLMDYNGHFDKNIGLFVTETEEWHHCGWHDYLNNMDEVWVPNTEMLRGLQYNKVTRPGFLVPHACGHSKYHETYEPLDIEQIKGNFVFYTISEYNRRKNISAIIRAYFMAFTKNDPVSLVIKVSKHGMNPQHIYEDIIKIANDIKASHKLYMKDEYPHIVIIPNYMPEEEINRLHVTGDCFINASFGEAWSIPTFDAMGFNKYVISGNWGGPMDFLRGYNKGYRIGGVNIPVFGMTETFPQMNTARESWSSIDIKALSRRMKALSYDISSIQQPIAGNGLEQVKKYSYEAIGNRIKELLCT